MTPGLYKDISVISNHTDTVHKSTTCIYLQNCFMTILLQLSEEIQICIWAYAFLCFQITRAQASRSHGAGNLVIAARHFNFIAVATTEADKAITLSDFLKIMGISTDGYFPGVILVTFDHFASSDFNVWLWSWSRVGMYGVSIFTFITSRGRFFIL